VVLFTILSVEFVKKTTFNPTPTHLSTIREVVPSIWKHLSLTVPTKFLHRQPSLRQLLLSAFVIAI